MQHDHFQPEKIIAAGPSAKVYRGAETMTGRKVLIKALLPDYETAHPLDRERLQLLAPSLMQMRHPQIAGLITLLPSEEEFAIVSEFMPGMNARTFAAERRPTPADLRALAVQLMHALLVGEHLRQPHGDPKPSNLIIADHPGGGLFLQVQDWGLSLARQTHPPETLWFRAPELHSGGMPTTQSDLFTAAGSLFCLATNTAPTQGSTVEEVMQDWQAFNAGYVLSHLRPDLDAPLRDWLAWLLNPMPHMRPQAVAQALDMLMLSMHTGFAYMPQQAPVMAPGYQTTPLMAAVPPPPPAPVAAAAPPPSPQAQAPASSAPKPRSVQPKSAPAPVAVAVAASASPVSTATAAAPATPTPAPSGKKTSGSRIAMAVILNLAAVTMIGFFVWPIIQKSLPKVEVSASTSTSADSKSSGAAPAATAGGTASASPAAPAPVQAIPAVSKVTDAPAMTDAAAKAR
ncbi:serine/threonine protein kinase [Prosthecobacter sp.]|uniref:serine/threonine protein kinase n=1 Tax=Prosthecobacter sp. TaxID=1965333 RepID=UPI003784D01D